MNKDERINLIIEFETNTINEKDFIRLFKDLIKTGMVWKLQGVYGRTATNLIEQGIIKGV